METSERFDRAIKALVKGYMNDTLTKGSCFACAVGNIVADCMGFKIKKHTLRAWGEGNITSWDEVFFTAEGKQRLLPELYKGEAKKQIDSTGYTWQELARVEKAFECSTDMYDGLMKVVDVLCDIEGINQDAESYKELFVKV